MTVAERVTRRGRETGLVTRKEAKPKQQSRSSGGGAAEEREKQRELLEANEPRAALTPKSAPSAAYPLKAEASTA